MTAADVVARRPGIADAPDTEIEALIAEFEELAERYLGVAYIPREDVEYVGHPVNGVLRLPHRQVTEATVVNDDDVAVTVDKLHVDRGDIEVATAVRLTVTYTHGFAAPTNRLLGACARWVERMIVVDRTGTSRDTLSQAFEGGTTRYSTPDWGAGRPTGFLQVDSDLNAERSYRMMVA